MPVAALGVVAENISAGGIGVGHFVEKVKPAPDMMVAGTVRPHPELVVLPEEIILPFGFNTAMADSLGTRRKRKRHQQRYYLPFSHADIVSYNPRLRPLPNLAFSIAFSETEKSAFRHCSDFEHTPKSR